MRILVTGGAGFIGSFVAERGLALGHDIRILDNLDPQVHPTGMPAHTPTAAEFIRGDVRDRATCSAAIDGVDAVVHCAAAVGVGQSMYRVEHYIDVNVRGTATLLECLIERKPPLRKLVVPTSMTGYGEGLYRRPSDGAQLRVPVRTEEDIERDGWEPVCPHTKEPLTALPTPETAELLTRNVYALSKRYQEELCLTLGAVYGFPTTCLRLFNVYGPRQSLSNPYTGVMAIFLSRLLSGEPPVVYEDGLQSRDFVSVHDVVDAMVAALGSSASDGHVLNIGSGVPRGIAEIGRTLAKLTGRETLQPTITKQYRRGDVRHCVADITRARDTLGFTPRVAFETGLAEVVRWAAAAGATDGFADADRELRERGLIGERPIASQGAHA